MPSILDDIVQTKRDEVRDRSRDVSLEEIKERALAAPEPRNFFQAVTQPARRLKVIAEVKRASPSAGVIRHDFDAVDIATTYHANGAAAISCLTDERYFQGRLEDVQRIKDAVPLPVLRKDFLIDPWQLYESRAAGADAVLLIAECLREPEMIDLLILATELKMTTLVEVHDLESLIQVKSHLGFPLPGYQLLGINNRDLRAMTTDIKHTMALLGEVPDKGVLVSESGIREHADVAELLRNGVYRILVGESLMKQEDPGLALRELIHGDDGGENFSS